MKLLELKCKNCGSLLKVKPGTIDIHCNFCQTNYKLDDEVKHLKYDEMERAGYDYELGRMKARDEYEKNKRHLKKLERKAKFSKLLEVYCLVVFGFCLLFGVFEFLNWIAKNIELSKPYELGTEAEIAEAYNSGKYCTNGLRLWKGFDYRKRCADIPEISGYECTDKYCAVIYEKENDYKTYIIFERYNKNTEAVFKQKYNKPMTVYGDVIMFRTGIVAIREYDDSQIQTRVEYEGVSVRCDRYWEFYKEDATRCSYH